MDYVGKNFILILVAMIFNIAIYFLLTTPSSKLSETPQHWNDWSIDDVDWRDENPPAESTPEELPSESYDQPKTFEEAKLLSVKLQRPVFAVFTTEWCAACKIMHKTLADPDAKSALNGFITIEVNAEKDISVASLGIGSVPTSIILRPDGQITKRSVGAMSVEQLKSWLK